MYCSRCQFESDNQGDFRADTDGNDYCELCFDRLFTTCTRCDVLVSWDECIEGDGDQYCPDCYDYLFTSCGRCSEPIHRDGATYSDGGDAYCDSCYERSFFHCSGCGSECSTDDYEGAGLCTNCHQAHEESEEYGRDWDMGNPVVGRTFVKTRSRRRFGVELEVSEADGYRDLEDNTRFAAKNDGTSGVSKEFVSPVLQGDEGLDEIANFCRQAGGFEVSKACGYHLHVDCTGLGVRQRKAVAAAYCMTCDVWASFVPDDRRCNTYCKRHDWSTQDIRDKTWDSLIKSLGHNRYVWCNWLSYSRHNTVEIRIHGGTVDYRKIVNWVIAHTRFVDWAAGRTLDEICNEFAGKTLQERFDRLCEIWGDEQLCKFFHRRAEKFGVTYASVPCQS